MVGSSLDVCLLFLTVSTSYLAYLFIRFEGNSFSECSNVWHVWLSGCQGAESDRERSYRKALHGQGILLGVHAQVSTKRNVRKTTIHHWFILCAW